MSLEDLGNIGESGLGNAWLQSGMRAVMRRTVMYTLIALASVAMAAGALADTAVSCY
jgi:hypothetical protein